MSHVRAMLVALLSSIGSALQVRINEEAGATKQ